MIFPYMEQQVTFASRQLNAGIRQVWHFDPVIARGCGIGA